MKIGKKALAIVLTVMLISVASASLVYYESNVKEDTAAIESPLKLTYDGDMDITYGGSCEYMNGWIENQANNPIDTILAIAIEGPDIFLDPIVEFAGCAACGEDGYYQSMYKGYVSFTLDNGETIYLPLSADNPVTFDDDNLPEGDNVIYAITPVIGLEPSENVSIIIDFVTHPQIMNGTYTITTVCVSPELTENRVMRELVLENKDSDWKLILEDGIGATVTYNVAGPEICYDVVGTGLHSETEYILIYYADKPDRFVNWGGNNPGALIGTGTTDESGDLSMSGVIDLNMNLPCEPDWNINPDPDYCETDGYDHCCGAKLWLVPSSDYAEPEMIAWNPTTYLFETDLISYTDTDVSAR